MLKEANIEQGKHTLVLNQNARLQLQMLCFPADAHVFQHLLQVPCTAS